MNRFIRRVLIYSLSIALIGYATIYILTKLKPGKMLGDSTEYALWNYKKELIDSSYQKGKNVIIGDSRSMTGFNPQIIGHNTINLALSGTTPFEGYSVLKRFYSKNKIDTLIISYGIFHFLKSDILEKWTLPYTLPTREEVHQLEKLEKHFGVTIDNQKPRYSLYLRRNATYNHNPLVLRETFVENIKQNDYNKLVINEMKETSGYTNLANLDSCDKLNIESEIEAKEKKFNPNPVIASYLDSIYNIGIRNKTVVLFLIPPVNLASYRHLKNKPFWGQYLSFKQQLQLRYPRMSLDNKHEYLPNTYFNDSGHLNRRGVIFMSTYIKHKLDARLKY
jgi:hypothetical protein